MSGASTVTIVGDVADRLKTVLTALSRNVRERRRRLKLSQAEAARVAGMDVRHVQRIESRETNPSLAVLVRLATALRTSVAELVRFRER